VDHGLFLNTHSPGLAGVADFDYCIAFRLGSAGNIARTTRVIEYKFESLTARHLFEPNFGIGPVQRALNSAQIELYRATFHDFTLAYATLGGREDEEDIDSS